MRVNRKGGDSVCTYFITFQAKDEKAGSQNFQTKLGTYEGRIDIGFCRVEKKLEEPQGILWFHLFTCIVIFTISDCFIHFCYLVNYPVTVVNLLSTFQHAN